MTRRFSAAWSETVGQAIDASPEFRLEVADPEIRDGCLEMAAGSDRPVGDGFARLTRKVAAPAFRSDAIAMRMYCIVGRRAAVRSASISALIRRSLPG